MVVLYNATQYSRREREPSEAVDRRDCRVVVPRTTLLSTAGPTLHAAGLLAYIDVNVTATVASKSRATLVHGCRSKRPPPAAATTASRQNDRGKVRAVPP